MSTHLDHLPIGAPIEVRGPKGAFNYTPTLAPYLLLVAGGSGITPMYRIIKSAALDPEDKTRMALVFANVAEEDVRGFWLAWWNGEKRITEKADSQRGGLTAVLRNELEFLASKSNGRLVIHVSYLSGHV